MDRRPDIRHLPDGAIDYEFYRRKTRAQRSAAIRDFFALKRRSGLAPTFLTRRRAARKS